MHRIVVYDPYTEALLTSGIVFPLMCAGGVTIVTTIIVAKVGSYFISDWRKGFAKRFVREQRNNNPFMQMFRDARDWLRSYYPALVGGTAGFLTFILMI